MNEVSVEISKAQKRLDLLNSFGDGPVGNGTDFERIHRKTIGRDDIANILDRLDMKLAFLGIGKESVFP